MDAYVLGALPPYNQLLGGKLVSYIMASNEIRELYRRKYHDQVTILMQRKADDLVCLFTTGLFGKSSQYSRIKYRGRPLYLPIGRTQGYGTLHLTDETFSAMRELLVGHGLAVTNRFGDGPVWRMRVIRSVAEILGFDSDFLLRHSFQRQIYAIPLAENFRAFLSSETKHIEYLDYPYDDLVATWRARWLSMRKANPETQRLVETFLPRHFNPACS